MHTLLRLAFIVGCSLQPLQSSLAQDYALRQSLRPPASGEGRPSTFFGRRIAVDGDLALVGDQLRDGLGNVLPRTHLRAYRRLGGVWQRASELDRKSNAGALMQVALSGNRLVYSMDGATHNTVRIEDLGPNGWVYEYGRVSTSVGFATSVAVADNIVVVGDRLVNSERGLVSIYRRGVAPNSWEREQLSASIQQVEAHFGGSVAIVAGAVVVGAPDEDVVDAGITRVDAGAAYVFELTQSTWTEVARLTATTPEANAHFGSRVAISGLDESTPDRMLVAARAEQGDTGAVYGFRRNLGNWVSAFRISDPQAAQRFGIGLSLDGPYAAIGAELYDVSAELSNTGAVYGLTFNPDFTAVASVQRRTPPQPRVNQLIGASVAVDRSGPTTFVGDTQATLYGNLYQGEVLLSQGLAGEPFPNLVRALDLGQGLSDARFGTLSVDGDGLLVGAANEDVGSIQDLGAAYFYRRLPDGQYQFEQRIASPDGASGDQFGAAVAIAGDIALIGAPNFDSQFGTDTGKVYVYRRNSGTWTLESTLLTTCGFFDRRHFGRALAFNGTQALIGEICNDNPERAEDGDISTRLPNGTWQRRRFGIGIRMTGGAWDGDLAIVGSPSSIGAPENYSEGEVSTFREQAGEWFPARPDLVGQSFGQGFGLDVSAANGLMAAASVASNAAVKLYRRSDTVWLPEANLIPDAGGAGAATRVALRGGRVGVGVPGYFGNGADEGAVYVFARPGGVWAQQQQLRSPSPEESARFGGELAMHPDGDIFVAARHEDGEFSDEGAVYIYAPPSPFIFADGFE